MAGKELCDILYRRERRVSEPMRIGHDAHVVLRLVPLSNLFR